SNKSANDLTDESKHNINMSFYFTLCHRMAELEPMLVEFYSKLLRQLGLLNSANLMINDSEQTLTEELLRSVVNSKEDVAEGVEFPLFRGAYIRLFEDGSLFQRIMFEVFDALGEARYSEYKLKNKSNPKLRTFYRFIDYSFISQLPLHHYTAFQADTLLYCEWRCAHPNLIGFHLLILAWMLDAREFFQFAPAGIQQADPLRSPLLRSFWPMAGQPRIRLLPSAKSPTEAAPPSRPPPRSPAKTPRLEGRTDKRARLATKKSA
uniref:RGS domain-containing protein n=1 Tax=Macrostomum lignano TaxID=282301 RepID=A0A1I8J0Q5_9PLAT